MENTDDYYGHNGRGQDKIVLLLNSTKKIIREKNYALSQCILGFFKEMQSGQYEAVHIFYCSLEELIQ